MMLSSRLDCPLSLKIPNMENTGQHPQRHLGPRGCDMATANYLPPLVSIMDRHALILCVSRLGRRRTKLCLYCRTLDTVATAIDKRPSRGPWGQWSLRALLHTAWDHPGWLDMARQELAADEAEGGWA